MICLLNYLIQLLVLTVHGMEESTVVPITFEGFNMRDLSNLNETNILRYGHHKTQECNDFKKAYVCIMKCLELGYQIAKSDKKCVCTCYKDPVKAKYFSKVTKGWKVPTMSVPQWALPKGSQFLSDDEELSNENMHLDITKNNVTESKVLSNKHSPNGDIESVKKPVKESDDDEKEQEDTNEEEGDGDKSEKENESEEENDAGEDTDVEKESDDKEEPDVEKEVEDEDEHEDEEETGVEEERGPEEEPDVEEEEEGEEKADAGEEPGVEKEEEEEEKEDAEEEDAEDKNEGEDNNDGEEEKEVEEETENGENNDAE